MAFKKEVFIKAPVETVFNAATDFNNAMKIMENVVGMEVLTDGPVQQGTKIKEVRNIRGMTAEAILTVSEFTPNQSYSVHSENNGILVDYHYSFLPKDEGTVVQFEGIIRTKGLKNLLLKPIVTKIIKKEDENHLEKLREVIMQEGE